MGVQYTYKLWLLHFSICLIIILGYDYYNQYSGYSPDYSYGYSYPSYGAGAGTG